MLFFLRQVRRKLMNESKVTTYLLYAVGEIVLVVAGILIAVSIDNWNQEQEKNKAELKSYQDIVNDLKKDSVRFDERIQNVKMRLSILYQLNEVTLGEAKVL